MATGALPLLVYALVVLAAVLLPYAAPKPSEANDRPLMIALAGGAVLLTLLRGMVPAEGALLLLVASFGLGPRALVGSAAAALLLATTTWWLLWVEISPFQHWLTAAACLAMSILARRCRFDPADETSPPHLRGEAASLTALFVLAILAAMLTGATNFPDAARMAWHHWGAYLSPVHGLLGGGVPYRDFPVQYGMGPTLMLAAACQANCWAGIYWVTVIANALLLVTYGWMALLLTRGMDRASRGLALAALAAAVLIWTGFPANWGNGIMTPSVGGLRFLPLALITAIVLTVEAQKGADLSRGAALAGHALWLLCLAWSPETGFFTTLVWWPWLALRRAEKGKWRALVTGGLVAGVAVVGGYAALALLFHATFGEWPALGDFLLYIRNPPLPHPVTALGPIWFAVAVLAFAGFALASAADPVRRRTLYAVTLAAIAAFSYFLSRSHDNNLINLLPWLIVTMLAAQRALQTAFGAGFMRAALAGIVALVASIHFHPWTVRPGAASIAGLQIGHAPLTERFAPAQGDFEPLIEPDAAALLAALRREGNPAVVLIEAARVIPTSDPAKTWTGMNSAANFLPLPPEVIRRYVIQGAKVFRRPGWLVVQDKEAAGMLGLFAAGYTISEQRRRGQFAAYLLVPRKFD